MKMNDKQIFATFIVPVFVLSIIFNPTYVYLVALVLYFIYSFMRSDRSKKSLLKISVQIVKTTLFILVVVLLYKWFRK